MHLVRETKTDGGPMGGPPNIVTRVIKVEDFKTYCAQQNDNVKRELVKDGPVSDWTEVR